MKTVTSNSPFEQDPGEYSPRDAVDPTGGRPKPKKRRGPAVLTVVVLLALLAAFLVGRLTAPKSTLAAPAGKTSPIASTSSAASAAPATATGIGDSTTSAASPSASDSAGNAAAGPSVSGLGTVSLVDLTAVSGSFDNGDKSPTVDGKSQLQALSATLDSCSNTVSGDAQYNLGREYTQLTAELGVDDNSAVQTTAPSVEIDGDGLKLGVWTPTLGKPADITVNVTGVLRLDIKWSDPGLTCDDYAASYLVVGNGQLTTGPNYVASSPSAG